MPKTLIVTGGSRGIGAATALLAGKQGYSVCVNYLKNQQAAYEVVQAIQHMGASAMAVQGDVSVESDVLKLFRAVDETWGTLNALVNNAGIVAKAAKVQEMEAARLQTMFAVNITGTFLCAREAIKRMSTHLGGTGGAIVNVSSAAARLGSPGEFIDYAASKGAIDTFTVGLAKELGDAGIRVNAVRPGLIETEIHEESGIPHRIEKLKHNVPMQRVGTAEEVAKAILWLLSQDASYSTGAILDVSGGR